MSGYATKLIGYCFVNNTTIVQIHPTTNTTTDDTVKPAQEGFNIFAVSARATRGQVIFQKTKWHLLEFTWYPSGKWHLENNNDHISLENQEVYKLIEGLPPSQASMVIGVWIS